MKKGRPKKRTDDFPRGWVAHIIELGEEGASDVEMRDYLDICHETWTRFLAEDKIFSETIKKARTKCEVWWQKQGRVNLKEKEFSPVLWYMNMKNRFGWRDKNEIDHTTNGESINKIERVIIDSNTKN